MLRLLKKYQVSIWLIVFSWTELIPVDGQCTSKTCTAYGEEDQTITCTQQNEGAHYFYQIDQRLRALEQVKTLTEKVLSQIETLTQVISNQFNTSDRQENLIGRFSQRLSSLEQHIDKQDQNSKVLSDKVISQIEVTGRNISSLFEAQTGNISDRLEKHDENLQKLSRHLEELVAYSRNQSATNDVRRFSDCTDIRRRTIGYLPNGVYEISVLTGFTYVNVNVSCEFNASGESWLIFQRRYDGSVDFNRNYEEYSKGFGDLDGEFWLGNELLHFLTSKRNYKLRIDLEDWEGNASYAEYSTFRIGSSATNYTLNVSGYSGNAENCMTYHSGQQFSAKDADHDSHATDCARYFGGGWWYNACLFANPNGIYRRGAFNITQMHWWSPQRSHYSLKKIKMKISAIL